MLKFTLFSANKCFYCDAMLKRKLNTVPMSSFFFFILAGWSRATFNRQVEVCVFHHNLSLLSLLFYCLRGSMEQHRKVGVGSIGCSISHIAAKLFHFFSVLFFPQTVLFYFTTRGVLM